MNRAFLVLILLAGMTFAGVSAWRLLERRVATPPTDPPRSSPAAPATEFQAPSPLPAPDSDTSPQSFDMTPIAEDAGANDFILRRWQTLRRGVLRPPAALLTTLPHDTAASSQDLLVFRFDQSDAERVTVSDDDVEHSIRRLLAQPDVMTVVENIRLHTLALPPTRYAPVQWALENRYAAGLDIGWARVRPQVVSIEPSLIGIVDAGIDFADPRLAPAAWTNPREIAANGMDDDDNGWVDDVHGINLVISGRLTGSQLGRFEHGSFVSSIIAGRPVGAESDVIGIAPRAQLVAAVTFRAEPAQDRWRADSELARSLDGIRYVVERGARVVNLSFGARVSLEQLERLNRLPLWDDLERRGVILVCAAGNSGSDNDRHPVFPASLPRPNVISVMAVDAEGRPGRSWEPRTQTWREFSNYGAQTVDLAAPGTLVLGACWRDDVELLSGTSYSAAMVTAAAALVRGRHPEWSADQVIAAILQSCQARPALRGRCRAEGSLDLAALLGQRD